MKKRLNDWTKVILCFILSELIFPGYLCLGQTGPVGDVKSGESLELREAKVARESAEKQVLDLELEIDKLRRDYTKLRSKYAELYMETYKAVKNLRSLELTAANLVQKEDGKDSGRDEAIEAMELVLSRQIELQNALKSYQDYLSAAMDVLQPSEAVKSELDKRGKNLADAVDNCMKPLTSLVLKGGTGEHNSCSVVSINEELELVILDKGTLHGIKTGSKWKLMGLEGETLAKLQTVDARPEISAAVVMEGTLGVIRTGSVLVKDDLN